MPLDVMLERKAEKNGKGKRSNREELQRNDKNQLLRGKIERKDNRMKARKGPKMKQNDCSQNKTETKERRRPDHLIDQTNVFVDKE